MPIIGPVSCNGSNGNRVETWIEYSIAMISGGHTVTATLYAQTTEKAESTTKYSGSGKEASITINGSKNVLSSNLSYDFTDSSTTARGKLNNFGTVTVTISHTDATTINIAGAFATRSSYITGVTNAELNGNVTLPSLKFVLTADPRGGTYRDTTEPTSFTNPTLVYGTGNYNVIGVPTRTGFTFNGWYSAPTGGTQIYDSAGNCVPSTAYFNQYTHYVYSGDLTVYAQWTANGSPYVESYYFGSAGTYYAIFVDDKYCNNVMCASWTLANSQDDIKWIKPTAGEWVRGGYTYTKAFIVSYSNHNNEYGTYMNHIYSDSYDSGTYLFGVYVYRDRILSFDPNGGSVSQTELNVRDHLAYNYYGSFPTPTRDGYKFVGWFTEPEGGTQVYETDIALAGETENIQVYAHWEALGRVHLMLDGKIEKVKLYVNVGGEIKPLVMYVGAADGTPKIFIE